MTRLDWEKAARQEKVRKRGGKRIAPGPTKPKGPTNEQRAYLKKLAKQASESTPMPSTRAAAVEQIKRLKRKLKKLQRS